MEEEILGCWWLLLGDGYTNTLLERLTGVLAQQLKGFHDLFFWNPFQFL